MIKNSLIIEGARIGFRNFSGEEGKFNPKGRRNFCAFLEYDHGLILEKEGWNIKWLEPREEGDERVPYLQVRVSFDNFPPNIMLVTKKGKTKLDESSIDILDWAEIENVDLEINPYNWEVSGKTGTTAYARAMYVTIREDAFADKYYDVPDSAVSSLQVSDDAETY